MVIKRIGPLSLAKIAGTLYAVVGLVIGCIFSLFAMAGGFGTDSREIGAFAPMIGAGAILVLPILYGCLGFIAMFIGAWIYNGLAGLVGGIELDIQ
jgi:hypothetical protein